MSGIESMRACWFITNPKMRRSADDAARLALGGCHVALQAAHGDFEARDTLRAGHRRRLLLADRLDESEQLGAQRLGMPRRQVSHRIAAIRLKSEAFGHLPRQKIAD